MSSGKIVRGYAYKMKVNPTEAEAQFKKRLKKVLRKHFPYLSGAGIQITFKHPRGWYIVDFYIGELRLGFEIDGGYHWGDKQLNKDLERDYFFDSKNIHLVHIPNSRLDKNYKRRSIEEKLKKIIESRLSELKILDKRKFDKLMFLAYGCPPGLETRAKRREDKEKRQREIEARRREKLPAYTEQRLEVYHAE